MNAEGKITNVFTGNKGWKGLQLDGNLVYGGFDLPDYQKGERVAIEYEQTIVNGKTYQNVKTITPAQQAEAGQPQEQPPAQAPSQPAQAASTETRRASPQESDIKEIVTKELDLMSEIISQANDYKRFKDMEQDTLQKYLVSVYIQAHKEHWSNGFASKGAR